MRAAPNKPVPTTPSVDPLLSPRDVAAQLRVSLDTVARWTRRGDLPAIKLASRGGTRYRVRYSQAAITAWLADQPRTGV